MPDHIMLPLATDLIRGDNTRGKKHCAGGWLDEWFLEHSPHGGVKLTQPKTAIDNRNKAAKIFCRIAKERGLKPSWGTFPAIFNDCSGSTLEQIAEVLEATVIEMGYDVK